MKNPKRKGNRQEHRTMAILEAAGYACTRSAASLGDWDIVGVGSSDFVLVQCKTRDWPSSEEMETLRSFVCPANCHKIVHRWRDRERLPDCQGTVRFPYGHTV
jgi:Holliday junction resolvase